MKIIITADLHIGLNFDFKKVLGVSKRALDYVNQLEKIMTYAIETGAELLIIAGDFYDKPIVNATIKKLLRHNVIIPAMTKNVVINENEKDNELFTKKNVIDTDKKGRLHVVIIGGNHDSPRTLTKGCDIEDLGMIPKITCVRSFNKNVMKYKGSDSTVGLVLIPYMDNDSILKYEMKKRFEELKEIDEITNEIAASYISNNVIKEGLKKITDVDRKLLIGHYTVSGSKLSNRRNASLLGGMQMTRDELLEDEFDLIVMGHVHKHQTIGNKIIIPGSPEKTDFGERDEKKYFIEYDTITNEWKSIELPCRKMIQIEVDLLKCTGDPTDIILKEIYKNEIKDAFVKLVISSTQVIKERIDRTKIETALKDCFYSIFTTKIFDEELPMIDLSRTRLDDHETLLDGFLLMRFPEKEIRVPLSDKSKMILKSCTEEDDS